MNPSNLDSRSCVVVADGLKCPYCFWDEVFSSQFELEWHVLKKHGKSMLILMLKNGKGIANPRWTKMNIDVDNVNWVDGKKFKQLGDSGISEVFPPHSSVHFIENPFNHHSWRQSSPSELKYSGELDAKPFLIREERNGTKLEERAGISCTGCINKLESFTSKRKCEPLFGLEKFQSYNEADNFKAVGKSEPVLGLRKIQNNINEPVNSKMMDRIERSFGGNKAQSRINESRNLKMMEGIERCLTSEKFQSYSDESENLTRSNKSNCCYTASKAQKHNNELDNLKIVGENETCFDSKRLQTCINEPENPKTVKNNEPLLSSRNANDSKCKSNNDGIISCGGNYLQPRKQKEPVTEPAIEAENIAVYEMGKDAIDLTHKNQWGIHQRPCTSDCSESSISQCITSESFLSSGNYRTSDELAATNGRTVIISKEKIVPNKCRAGMPSEVNKSYNVMKKAGIPKNKRKKKSAIHEEESFKRAKSSQDSTRSNRSPSYEMRFARKENSDRKTEEVLTAYNENLEMEVPSIKDYLEPHKGTQTIRDVKQKEGCSVELNADGRVAKLSNSELKKKATKTCSQNDGISNFSHDQGMDCVTKGNTTRFVGDTSTALHENQEKETVSTKNNLELGSGMQNLPEIQRNGGYCVKIGDISIRVGEKVIDAPDEKLQTSSCKEEISEIRQEIKDLTDRFSVKNIVTGRIEKDIEIPAEQASKLNEELMNELKKALIEGNDIEAVARQWKSKYFEIENKLRQVEEDRTLCKAQYRNLVSEKEKVEVALGKAEEKLADLQSELGKMNTEFLCGNQKIKWLESLLKEKEQAIEEMINIDAKECDSVCENVELRKIGSSESMEDRIVSHSLSSSLSCLSRLVRKRNEKKAGISKKKTMKLIIDELDGEIAELEKKLSTERKKFTLLTLCKEERTRELEIYKDKVVTDAAMLQNAQRDLDSAKSNLDKEQRQHEKLVRKLTKEKDILWQQNEDFSKELAALKEELRKAAWRLKFAESYNAEMEGKLQKCISLMKKRAEEERRKSQEAVKLLSFESERKDEQLRGLKAKVNAARRENKNLQERLEESATKTCANQDNQKSTAIKWKGNLIPDMGLIVEKIARDFISIISEYSNGKVSKMKLMQAVCELGSQISKIICRQEESCRWAGEDAMATSSDNQGKENVEILKERCQCQRELSLFGLKFEKLEEELRTMRERYERRSEEGTVIKHNGKEAEKEVEMLHKENERMFAELCKFNKFMSDHEALGNLENDCRDARQGNRESKGVVEALNLVEWVKDEKQARQESINRLLHEQHALEEKLKQLMDKKELYQQRESLLMDEKDLNRNENRYESEKDNLKKRYENIESSLHGRQKLYNQSSCGGVLDYEISRSRKETVLKPKSICSMRCSEDRVLDYAEEIEKLQDELGCVEKKHIGVPDTLENALSAKNVAEKILREKGYEMNKLIAERKESMEELDKRSSELNSTIGEFNNLLIKSEELKVKEKDCKESSVSSDALEKYREIMRLRDNILDLKGRLEEERSGNDKIFQAKEEELRIRMEEIMEMREKLIELSEMYRNVNGKVDELKSNIKLDYTDREEFERRLKNANLKIEKLRSENSACQLRSDGQEARLDQMLNEMVHLEKEKRELGLLISQYKKSVCNLDRKIDLQMKKSGERMEHMVRGFCIKEKEPFVSDGNKTLCLEVESLALDRGLIGLVEDEERIDPDNGIENLEVEIKFDEAGGSNTSQAIAVVKEMSSNDRLDKEGSLGRKEKLQVRNQGLEALEIETKSSLGSLSNAIPRLIGGDNGAS